MTPQQNKIPFISAQIEAEKALISRKFNGGQYIAYFQSYTNTYAPADYLRQIFTEAIRHDDVRILSIATRPDCITPAIVTLLSELNAIKPVWVELGLQTIHESSARYIRRGYSLSVFDDAMKMLIISDTAEPPALNSSCYMFFPAQTLHAIMKKSFLPS